MYLALWINKWMLDAVRLTLINGIYCQQNSDGLVLLTKIFNAPALCRMDMLRQISFSDLCISPCFVITRMINWLRSFFVGTLRSKSWKSIFCTIIHLTRKENCRARHGPTQFCCLFRRKQKKLQIWCKLEKFSLFTRSPPISIIESDFVADFVPAPKCSRNANDESHDMTLVPELKTLWM